MLVTIDVQIDLLSMFHVNIINPASQKSDGLRYCVLHVNIFGLNDKNDYENTNIRKIIYQKRGIL